MYSGADTRTPEPPQPADTRPAPTHTPSPSSPETPRPPREGSTREPTRTNNQDSPSETGQPVKQRTETQENAPAAQQANNETGNNKEETTSGNAAPSKPPPQPQLADGTLSPELPAMVAALLNGIAGEQTEDSTDPETFARDMPTQVPATHSRRQDASGNLPARTATLVDSAVPSGVDTENDAGDDGNNGTNPNSSTLLTGGRTPRDSIALTQQGQTATTSGTGNEPLVRTNAAASDTIVNIANAASMASHEDGGARTVPTGAAANAGDISMLNPPRLPSQAGAAHPQFTIPSGTGQKAWAEEVGNRVMWMLGRAQSRAELILTPPLLGKVEVSIHLNGDQSTAQFFASSQSAREALEQAMPRLRELLAQAGINLGEANVNTSAEDRTQGGENTHRTGTHTPDVNGEGGEGDASVIAVPNWSRLDSGLINTYA
ncbi:MAG: flagellar hook-length control protein FliK [Betaproteobacteria bacterium]|nr:flagellar hook-length control protein FliK [Betaproteobacteria bacterium]